MATEAAWIETTHRSDEARTEWRIVVGDRVIEHGFTHDDEASGARAYQAAQLRAQQHKLAVAGWKHSVEQLQPMMFPVRGRTTTDKSEPIRLYGWAQCADDSGREALGLTPTQLRDLEEGRIPCPVCGEACGGSFEPSITAKPLALLWSGVRWHH